jgi:hypothetical protein
MISAPKCIYGINKSIGGLYPMQPTQQIRDIIDRLSLLESELGEAPVEQPGIGAKIGEPQPAGDANNDADGRAKSQKAMARMYQLAQNGLVDKGQVSSLNSAMKAMMSGSPLSSPQRLVMLDVMQSLMDLIGDDASLVSRIKQDLGKQKTVTPAV